ncbi:hypothetical protein ACVWW1_008752 [Bradyrhizobium sp. JR3.5]
MHAAVSEELRRRGVIRSSNNPVGDLAEHLFCRAFGWKQAPNSMRDADATDGAEVRYQIKGRRLTSHNRSRQLGALRDLPAQGFDVQGHGPQGAQRQLAALPRALHAQRAGACRQERAACRLSAFIATAFAQDDAEAARAQWRKVADQLRPIGGLLHERAQVHHLIGHRWFLGCVGVSQPDPTGESPVTTAKPPARYGAI